MKLVVFACCGDIGLRTALAMRGNIKDPVGFVGVRRHPPEGYEGPVHWLRCDLSASGREALECLSQADLVIATPVPHEGDYERGYLKVAENLLQMMESADSHASLFWVSSTSVYGDSGGRIDERTVPEPRTPSARILLQAEHLVRGAGVPSVILRPAGIYGPGRTALMRRAAGFLPSGADALPGNRIHSEDVAGALAHLAALVFSGAKPQPLYLLTDGRPVPRAEIMEWLQKRMRELGMAVAEQPLPAPLGRQGTGRPIGNDALLRTGYRLRYPDWKEAWRELLGQMQD